MWGATSTGVPRQVTVTPEALPMTSDSGKSPLTSRTEPAGCVPVMSTEPDASRTSIQDSAGNLMTKGLRGEPAPAAGPRGTAIEGVAGAAAPEGDAAAGAGLAALAGALGGAPAPCDAAVTGAAAGGEPTAVAGGVGAKTVSRWGTAAGRATSGDDPTPAAGPDDGAAAGGVGGAGGTAETGAADAGPALTGNGEEPPPPAAVPARLDTERASVEGLALSPGAFGGADPAAGALPLPLSTPGPPP